MNKIGINTEELKAKVREITSEIAEEEVLIKEIITVYKNKNVKENVYEKG